MKQQLSPHYFFDTISQLRMREEIVLYDKVIEFIEEDIMLVQDFLEIEFDTESYNYPYSSPKFDVTAAIWAAKTVYITCQIVLYREHKESELALLLPSFSNTITPSAILSADLCLRFLPQILVETTNIDMEDTLIPILKNILTEWHYSGIGVGLNIEKLNFEPIFVSQCLEQLYIDRVIEKKDIERAEIPKLNGKIKAVLGNYKEYYWEKLK